MNNMTEDNEMIDLLKELVSRLKQLESTVYDSSNILKASGIVTIDSPRPVQSEGNNTVPDADMISKMSWDDINSLVSNLGGN